MLKVPGKKPGTFAFLHEGYAYAKDKRGSGNIYRCVSRNHTTLKCVGKVLVRDGEVIVDPPHNHIAQPQQSEQRALIQEMISMCEDLSLDARFIFDTVCAGNPVVGEHLSFRTIKQKIDNVRKQLRPELPNSLQEMHTILENYEPLRGLYQGFIKTADNSVSLIFSTPQLLQMLGNVDRLFIDSTVTFKVSEEMHVVTVYAQRKNVDIAGAFILAKTVSLELMEAIWMKLFQEVPQLRKTVTSVISDYNAATMGSIRSRFPVARTHGCWFYYRQDVLKKWKALELTACQKELLWMAISLPLAPADQFKPGLTLMKTTNTVPEKFSNGVHAFLEYLRKTWAPVAGKIVHHPGIAKTNNAVERVHMNVRNSLGGEHRDYWKFIFKMKKLLDSHESDLQKINENEKVKRVSPRNIVNRDTRIKHKQHDLTSGRDSLNNFLRAFNRTHEDETFSELQSITISNDCNTGDVDGSLFETIAEENDDDHRQTFDDSDAEGDNDEISSDEDRVNPPSTVNDENDENNEDEFDLDEITTSEDDTSEEKIATSEDDTSEEKSGTSEDDTSEEKNATNEQNDSDQNATGKEDETDEESSDKSVLDAIKSHEPLVNHGSKKKKLRPPSTRERRLPARLRYSIPQSLSASNAAAFEPQGQQRGSISNRGRALSTRTSRASRDHRGRALRTRTSRASRENRLALTPTTASQPQGPVRGPVPRGRRCRGRPVRGIKTNESHDTKVNAAPSSDHQGYDKFSLATSTDRQERLSKKDATVHLAAAFDDVSLGEISDDQ